MNETMNWSPQNYNMDEELIEKRGDGYVTLWGRDADFVCHQSDQEVPHIDIFRFPPTDADVPLNALNVYMSGGMADVSMPIPDEYENVPANIEITAYSEEVIMNDSGKMDFICMILHWLAHYPLRENTFFASSQTFNIGSPIIPDSEMTAYYFAQTPIIPADDLFAFTPNATGFIHLIPISEPERVLAVNQGSGELLKLFNEHKMSPLFDLKRKSLI
jgi:hypothetical protein